MLKLSDLVIPWLKEKNFPLVARESESMPGTWYLDAKNGENYRVDPGSLLGAVASIVDDAAVPYVVLLYTYSMKYEFYNAVDPKFFDKLEEGITLRLKEHGISTTTDAWRPS